MRKLPLRETHKLLLRKMRKLPLRETRPRSDALPAAASQWQRASGSCRAARFSCLEAVRPCRLVCSMSRLFQNRRGKPSRVSEGDRRDYAAIRPVLSMGDLKGVPGVCRGGKALWWPAREESVQQRLKGRDRRVYRGTGGPTVNIPTREANKLVDMRWHGGQHR